MINAPVYAVNLANYNVGRNKNLIPGEVISSLIEGSELFCQSMREHGIEIHATGGETADVGDLVRTIIVDSTLVAHGKRSDIIDNSNNLLWNWKCFANLNNPRGTVKLNTN